MHYQQHSATLPDLQVEHEPPSVFLTQCHRNALDELSRSFSEKRPLAIMIGDGQLASRFVIQKFVSRLDYDVSVARITESCASATQFMRRLISAVGFEPKDMSLDDLESIFSMFLSFQKGHCKRTIVCIEEAQDSEWWVLDKIRHFVEREREEEFGLMFILSGQSGLKELLHTRPLNSICEFAGKCISLSPFTSPETREYVRRRMAAAGTSNIDQAFQYHAIPLIHELCGGVPDAIDSLISRSLSLAQEERVDLVTKGLVQRAHELLRSESEQKTDDEHAATLTLSGFQPRFGRLVVRLTGDEVREIALRQGNLLIGRSELCDIRIDSKVVSRHHTLIRYSADGATIVDLGSTNGTFVDGHRIREHRLLAGEIIAVGDCRIEYVLDDDRQAPQQESAGQSTSPMDKIPRH